MKRAVLIFLSILPVLFVLLLFSVPNDKTGLGGDWKVYIPDEYDLRLGSLSNRGEIRSVIYRLARPDWFNEGNLAILYEFSGTSETDCYDVGFYSVKRNRINLMGAGCYTIVDDVLTICYDDGAVKTFTRIQ